MLINQSDQGCSVDIYIIISSYWLPYTSTKHTLHNKGRNLQKCAFEYKEAVFWGKGGGRKWQEWAGRQRGRTEWGLWDQRRMQWDLERDIDLYSTSEVLHISQTCSDVLVLQLVFSLDRSLCSRHDLNTVCLRCRWRQYRMWRHFLLVCMPFLLHLSIPSCHGLGAMKYFCIHGRKIMWWV